jgi:hypothetical protein
VPEHPTRKRWRNAWFRRRREWRGLTQDGDEAAAKGVGTALAELGDQGQIDLLILNVENPTNAIVLVG